MRDRLDSSLKLWLSRGKQRDDLLGPGLPLAEGEKLVKDFGPSLSREQTDYVYASVKERKRRKQAQKRIRYAVMAAISALAIVAGFQWFQAERHRQSPRPKQKKHTRRKRWHLKQKSLQNSATSCGKRAGQASTKRSDSSSWESGEKASLFWRAQ